MYLMFKALGNKVHGVGKLGAAGEWANNISLFGAGDPH